MRKRNKAELSAFVERLGIMVEADGLPRIAGRIMGFLLVTPGPCRATGLARELKISHGSVSTNTRLLERLGILERVSEPGERAAAYQLTADPYGSLLRGQLDRMKRLHSTVSAARDGATADQGRERLDEMERFYRLAIKSTEALLSNWNTNAA